MVWYCRGANSGHFTWSIRGFIEVYMLFVPMTTTLSPLQFHPPPNFPFPPLNISSNPPPSPIFPFPQLNISQKKIPDVLSFFPFPNYVYLDPFFPPAKDVAIFSYPPQTGHFVSKIIEHSVAPSNRVESIFESNTPASPSKVWFHEISNIFSFLVYFLIKLIFLVFNFSAAISASARLFRSKFHPASQWFAV